MNIGKQKGHLYRTLQAMSIIPLLLLGLVITLFCYQTVKSAMYSQVHIELKNLADTLILTYDRLYPGDYHLVGTDAYDLMKGNAVLTNDYSILDSWKASTQTDLTIFYQDTRILTTVFDENNMRIVGSGASSRIIREVLETGLPQFYSNATIGDQQYLAYYTPLRNEDGSVIGMVYAGKPCTDVDKAIRAAVFPIILLALTATLLAGFLSSSYTHKLIISLQKIRSFLSKVSTGNLSVELDPAVLQRHDELSEMGYSALYMQRSLRNLIEQDSLTELNNRRFADKRLKQIQMQANIHGTSFVVAIGDIDFFKSVNDTYGHECGDMVLKKVAATLKKSMSGQGFVARWGGEEFLFLYDNTDLQTATARMEALLETIRQLVITYDDQPVSITMTFGLAEGGVNTNIKNLLQDADAKLYQGKANGRNQVVS